MHSSFELGDRPVRVPAVIGQKVKGDAQPRAAVLSDELVGVTLSSELGISCRVNVSHVPGLVLAHAQFESPQDRGGSDLSFQLTHSARGVGT